MKLVTLLILASNEFQLNLYHLWMLINIFLMESECGVQLSQLAAQSNLALEQAAWNTCIVSSTSYATAAVGNGKLVPFSTVGLQQPQCSPLEVAKI